MHQGGSRAPGCCWNTPPARPALSPPGEGSYNLYKKQLWESFSQASQPPERGAQGLELPMPLPLPRHWHSTAPSDAAEICALRRRRSAVTAQVVAIAQSLILRICILLQRLPGLEKSLVVSFKATVLMIYQGFNVIHEFDLFNQNPDSS